MPNKDKEARYQDKIESLGTENPICCGCGENNPHCIEGHHISARKYGDEIALMCMNCHRKQSDAQKDHPAQISNPPSSLERIGHLLLGLADLFEALIEKLREYGRYLIDTARSAVSA